MERQLHYNDVIALHHTNPERPGVSGYLSAHLSPETKIFLGNSADLVDEDNPHPVIGNMNAALFKIVNRQAYELEDDGVADDDRPAELVEADYIGERILYGAVIQLMHVDTGHMLTALNLRELVHLHAVGSHSDACPLPCP